MFQNYISVAFRNLIKNKLYSAINIIGLAVGLAACILIMLFVRDELSYDKHWSKADSLHRITADFYVPGREPFITAMGQGPVKAALENYFPEEIERVTRFNGMGPVVSYDGKIFNERIMWTDPDTADMFSFNVLAGDIHAALNDNASLAISESFAQKHFGDKNPIGEVMNLTLYTVDRDYKIAAVFEDLPHNTVLDFQALAMIDEKDFENFGWEFAQWFSTNNYVYLELKDGVSIETVNQRLPDFTNINIEIPPGFGGPDTQAADFIKYSTQPITDLQLNPRAPAGSEMKPTGSMEGVYIFSAIAGLILLIACINFMNLATAKSTKRAREVALRKVLGAQRSQLIIQFLGESILVALIGLILGIVLVEACLPTFGEFVSKDLYFSLTDGMTLAILLGLILVVGVLGGVYPALVLSGFLPARVLKANKSAETSGSASLRNVLVITQFAISIGLIIATGVVYGQKYYATTMDPGFNKDNLLVVRDLIRNGSRDQRDAFKEEVARLPGVVSVSYSFDRPSSGNNSNRGVTLPDSDASILIGYQSVGYDFFETYEVPVIAGRNYSREYSLDGMPSGEGAKPGDRLQGTMVINEAAVRRLGYASNEDAIGKSFSMGVDQDIEADMTIIGVVADLNFQSLRSVIRPEMFSMEKEIFSNLTVRFEGNGADMASKIEQVWNSMITSVPYRYEYVDESMAAEFEEEAAQSVMLGVFAGLAILIACLGLYGLASFTAERRTKEIGIRKVMGARVRDVVQLLVWQFSKPVLVANLIAWPVAVWGMLQWLETFPYRMDTWMLLPLCIGAGLIALTIAWATVGGNAAKVARSNPIKALRYE